MAMLAVLRNVVFVVPSRAIVAATLRVRDLALLRRALAQGRLEAPPAAQAMPGRSEFLPPAATHGIWLEFRESRGGFSSSWNPESRIPAPGL